MARLVEESARMSVLVRRGARMHSSTLLGSAEKQETKTAMAAEAEAVVDGCGHGGVRAYGTAG